MMDWIPNELLEQIYLRLIRIDVLDFAESEGRMALVAKRLLDRYVFRKNHDMNSS